MLYQKFYTKILGKKAFGEHLHLLNTIINVDWIIRSIYANAKNPNPKNRTESDPKKSIEPEPKLIKYPNGSKFWYLENRNQKELAAISIYKLYNQIY